ncbi:hypothetical protein NIES4071_17120 [Calothrix sp. NIES-4071]|nr:hypothetical protein NIES4071_17120 [Calothrix sp. NIES-4071]BAZ56045.1 hypothetical protein NIES4105_17070 [Calothrix sp. NIES-4105]
MINSLKLASAILFFVGAHLLVPKIADAAAKLNQPVVIIDVSPSKAQVAQDSNSEYEPPNYGGPDSEHASGTR